MPCVGGIAPCTGWVTGEPCALPFTYVDTDYSTINSMDFGANDLTVNWTGGFVTSKLKLILVDMETGLINDIQSQPCTDLTKTLGVGLIPGRDYKIFYRTEHSDGTYTTIPANPQPEWDVIPLVFLGTTVDPIVDGLDFIVDGITPDYVIDG